MNREERIVNLKQVILTCLNKDFQKYIKLLVDILKNREEEHHIRISFCQGVFDKFYTVQLMNSNMKEVDVKFLNEYDRYQMTLITQEWKKFYKICLLSTEYN